MRKKVQGIYLKKLQVVYLKNSHTITIKMTNDAICNGQKILRVFSLCDAYMVNNHLKISVLSLVVKELQIRTIMEKIFHTNWKSYNKKTVGVVKGQKQ